MKIYLAEGGSLFQMISKGGECINIHPVPNTQMLPKVGAEKDMKIYLADTGVRCRTAMNEQKRKSPETAAGAIFRDTNILQSFYYCDSFTCVSDAERCLGLPHGAFKNISACALGKKKTAYGFVWCYYE